MHCGGRAFCRQDGPCARKTGGAAPRLELPTAFRPAVFGELIPWLAMNRGGLVIFVHPISDNEVKDHRDRALWMGAVRPLDLSVLSDRPSEIDL